MICMSRIGLPIACEFMRPARVAICGILFREPINSTGRSICCLVQMVVIFLLGAAGTIQFCAMIFSRAPRASLSNQSPGDLMAPLEWHSATMASSMLPVAIQRKFFVTGRIDGRPHGKPFIKDLADNPEFLMLVGR